MTAAEKRAIKVRKARAEYHAFLDTRIDELHAAGFAGRQARDEADREWFRRRREAREKERA